MRRKTVSTRILIDAIAAREGTARELSEKYGKTVAQLKAFATKHETDIVQARAEMEAEARQDDEPEEEDEEPEIDIDDLWISKKSQRLFRYQQIVDALYDKPMRNHDATSLRELRSYMSYAAQELGQLMHRGSGASGDDSRVNYTINDVDMEDLR